VNIKYKCVLLMSDFFRNSFVSNVQPLTVSFKNLFL